MRYRKLGRSGVKVSEISLGSWLTYGGYVNREQAAQTIDRAYELGINFFDTANTYMLGAAEKVVGEALGKYPRNSYLLATKVWGKVGEGPNDRGLSRKHIIEQCDMSLKRLNLDYIDLYYCHSFDESTPMDETLRAMDDLVRRGKVLYVGVSNWSASQIAEAIHIADSKLLDRIVASQPPYNMFQRDIEKELIPLSDRYGVGQVVYSPLAQGVLAGKYSSLGDVPSESRAKNSKAIERYLTEDNLNKAGRLKEVAGKLDMTPTQLALAWVLRQPNVSSALIGASKPEQIDENVKASGVALPDEILQEIEDLLN